MCAYTRTTAWKLFFVDLLYPGGEHVLLTEKSIQFLELELNLKTLAINEIIIFILNLSSFNALM